MTELIMKSIEQTDTTQKWENKDKDTVFMKDELYEFLWALGERNHGVVGEAATFLGLWRQTTHIMTQLNMPI